MLMRLAHTQSFLSGMRSQSGLSMIEVLVALLLTSIGVLGYAGLQLRALDTTENTHYRTQATALAHDIAERVAANPQGYDRYANPDNWPQGAVGGGIPNSWDACLGNTSDCTPNQMATSDIEQARWFASQMLSNGRVLAEDCDDSPELLCVTVTWGETTVADCDPLANQCIRMEVLTWVVAP